MHWWTEINFMKMFFDAVRDAPLFRSQERWSLWTSPGIRVSRIKWLSVVPVAWAHICLSTLSVLFTLLLNKANSLSFKVKLRAKDLYNNQSAEWDLEWGIRSPGMLFLPSPFWNTILSLLTPSMRKPHHSSSFQINFDLRRVKSGEVTCSRGFLMFSY